MERSIGIRQAARIAVSTQFFGRRRAVAVGLLARVSDRGAVSAHCGGVFFAMALFFAIWSGWADANHAIGADEAKAVAATAEASSAGAESQGRRVENARSAAKSDGAKREPSKPAVAKAGLPLDELTDFSDPQRWWRNVVDFAKHKGLELSLNLASAIVILIVGRWMARAVTRMVGRVAVRAKVDETLVRFATHLAYAAMLAFVVLTALGRVGIDTTSFTAVVAAAGLAVGFALQGSLSNLAAGVMLIMFKPFKVGDTVQAGGSTGTVLEIQIFNTLIRTEANALVYVPNSSITSATITNFSAEQIRRIDLVVKCSYDNDLREVKRLLVEILDNDERVLRLPPPLVAVDQLGDSAINFLVQPWVRNEYYSAVRADLLEAIKLGFEDRGIRFAGQTRPAPTPVPAPTPPQLGIVKAA